MTSGTVSLRVDIPKGLHHSLRIVAAERGWTVKESVTRALEALVERKEDDR